MATIEKADIGNANELYNAMTHTFAKDGVPSPGDYPNYYGGSYADENDNLVVLVVGDVDVVKSDLMLRTRSSKVQYKPAVYTYNDLCSVMETINDWSRDNASTELAQSFHEWQVLDSENKIQVFMEKCDAEHMNAFRNEIIDHPAIEFVQSSGGLAPNVDINCGAYISVDGYQGGSVGFRARQGNYNGFVTCAHVVVYANTVVRLNGTQCTAPGINHVINRSVDTAFCRRGSNYTPTNSILGNTLSTEVVNATGTVNMLGGVTKKVVSGAVSSTNLSTSYTSDGITYQITNASSAAYPGLGGDSGGIVYTYQSAANTRKTAGMHIGTRQSNGHGVFIKAANIISALGITRY